MPAILRGHVNYTRVDHTERRAAPVIHNPDADRPWSAEEVATLRKLCAEGHDYATIGKILFRKETSCNSKALRLGIKRRHNVELRVIVP